MRATRAKKSAPPIPKPRKQSAGFSYQYATKFFYKIYGHLVFLRLLFLFKLDLLLIYRSYDATTTTIVAELAEVDALPGAEGKTAIGDGDGETHTEEGALGVGGHVVGTLHGVVIVGLALPHEAVHDLTEVGAHIGVGILVDAESTRGVLHEEVEQSRLRQGLREMFQYFTRN